MPRIEENLGICPFLNKNGDETSIWLVGCFGFNGPLKQYFSLYRAVSQKRGRKRRERIDESKNVRTTPTRTYCKRSRPLPYCNLNCRTPRHWKFTQHLCITRPPPTKPRIGETSSICLFLNNNGNEVSNMRKS